MDTGENDTSTGGSFWSRLSPLYKNRFLQGICAYILLVALIGLGLKLSQQKTLESWNSRIPHAITSVTDKSPQDFASQTPPDMPKLPDLPPVVPVNGKQQPTIALIMTNAGLSASMTERAFSELPAPVAMAFSPYTVQLQMSVDRAIKDKRDAILLLPMEPTTYPKDDPGPQALLSRNSTRENQKNIEWLLARSPHITGSMNFMGSRFLSDSANLHPVFTALKQKNLFFIENPGAPGTAQSEVTARRSKLPYLSSDVIVDVIASENDIRLQLVALEKIAAERGYAVGIVHPYPVTFNTLGSWADTLARRGFRLVPPSTLWQDAIINDADRQNGTDPHP